MFVRSTESLQSRLIEEATTKQCTGARNNTTATNNVASQHPMDSVARAGATGPVGPVLAGPLFVKRGCDNCVLTLAL